MTRKSRPYARIYAVVRRIPRGCVATYGQVAALAGMAGQARQVGYALHALDDDSDVPWHRVLNARGQVSPRAEPGFEHMQRLLLEGEGVIFDGGGNVCLETFRWQPRSRQGPPPKLPRRQPGPAAGRRPATAHRSRRSP